MSHGIHNSAPGSILHDGCAECEERAASPLDALTLLDHNRFLQAWQDMLAEKWHDGHGVPRVLSACDARLLNALYTIAVILQRHAGQDPRDTLDTITARCAALDAQHAALFGPRDA